ncbi:hypothetical protein MTR_6g004160 [Medicago truncatula]|uniref:Uncharacterized protein n=1 Tax=Medicago truncatula TaxID=3880 RepID=A0A072U6F7_MEDTR|nr:hypothetical protein MTR_6g004160 [Medicago truncatula]
MLLFRFLAYMKKVVDSGFATWCGGDGDDRRLPQRFRSQSSSFPGSSTLSSGAPYLQEQFSSDALSFLFVDSFALYCSSKTFLR